MPKKMHLKYCLLIDIKSNGKSSVLMLAIFFFIFTIREVWKSALWKKTELAWKHMSSKLHNLVFQSLSRIPGARMTTKPLLEKLAAWKVNIARQATFYNKICSQSNLLFYFLYLKKNSYLNFLSKIYFLKQSEMLGF